MNNTFGLFCNSGRGVSEVLCRGRSGGQRPELIGCRRSSIFDRVELALLDHVHGLDESRCARSRKSIVWPALSTAR